MEIITLGLSKLATGIGPFFLLLGLLIFVHELGHYLVAVYFGVRVETFSLGFGKKIFSYKRGDTNYCLSLIPLGGYVKMYGDDPTAEIPENERKYSFLHKPVWPRIAIVLAGPLMNLFFAVLIFAIIGLLGEEVPGTRVGDIAENTAAYAAGFRSGDKIQKVNDSPVEQWSQIKSIIENGAEKLISFEVARETKPTADTAFNSSLVPEVNVVQVTPTLGKNSFIFTTQRLVGQIQGFTTDSASPIIGITSTSSPAYLAGLRTFDLVEKINNTPVTYWRQLEHMILSAALTDSSSKTKAVTLAVRSYDPDEKDPQVRTITLDYSSLAATNPKLSQLGIAKSDLFLMSVRPKSPAAMAGLKKGDFVSNIDGQPVSTWQIVLDRVKSFDPNKKTIAFGIVRDGIEQTIKVAPELTELPTEQGAVESRYAIGVIPAIMLSPNEPFLFQTSNPFSMIAYGVSQSWSWTKLIALSFVRLIQNEVSARNIGGVITIGRVASKSFEAGSVAFLKMMAIISINLFLLNLLPVPVLDGGHLVFFTLEALKGTPISFKKLEIAQQVGLVLLLSLMLFALFNDITNLISSW